MVGVGIPQPTGKYLKRNITALQGFVGSAEAIFADEGIDGLSVDCLKLAVQGAGVISTGPLLPPMMRSCALPFMGLKPSPRT